MKFDIETLKEKLKDKSVRIWLAAGVLLLVLIVLMALIPDPPPQETAGEAAGEASGEAGGLCVLADLGLEGIEAGKCYTRSAFADLDDAPVLDGAGEPVTLNLSHPDDDRRAPAPVESCAHFRALTEEGWYALSSADMRRALSFQRTCGALFDLQRARAPETSHFTDRALSQADVEAIADSGDFGFTEDGAAPPQEEWRVERRDGLWRLSGDRTIVTVEALAHADFTGDGLGDVLVFAGSAAAGGTATAGEVAVVEKTGPQARARLTGR